MLDAVGENDGNRVGRGPREEGARDRVELAEDLPVPAEDRPSTDEEPAFRGFCRQKRGLLHAITDPRSATDLEFSKIVADRYQRVSASVEQNVPLLAMDEGETSFRSCEKINAPIEGKTDGYPGRRRVYAVVGAGKRFKHHAGNGRASEGVFDERAVFGEVPEAIPHKGAARVAIAHHGKEERLGRAVFRA